MSYGASMWWRRMQLWERRGGSLSTNTEATPECTVQRKKQSTEQSRAYSTVHFGKKGWGKNGCLWLLVLASRNPRWILKKSVKVITCGEWGKSRWRQEWQQDLSQNALFVLNYVKALPSKKQKQKSQQHGRISKVLCWANEDLHKRLLTLIWSSWTNKSMVKKKSELWLPLGWGGIVWEGTWGNFPEWWKYPISQWRFGFLICKNSVNCTLKICGLYYV